MFVQKKFSQNIISRILALSAKFDFLLSLRKETQNGREMRVKFGKNFDRKLLIREIKFREDFFPFILRLVSFYLISKRFDIMRRHLFGVYQRLSAFKLRFRFPLMFNK